MVELVLLNKLNWVSFIKIKISEEQKSELPSVLYSIAESSFEKRTLYGICLDSEPIGFVSILKTSGFEWLSRFIIDHTYQNKGHGSLSLQILIKKKRPTPLRTTVSKNNPTGKMFFLKNGFKAVGEDSLEWILEFES